MISSRSEPRRWLPPQLAATAASAPAGSTLAVLAPEPPNLDALADAARAEGYRQGHAEGLRDGSAEAAGLVAQMAQLLTGLAAPFAQQNDELITQLTDLIILFCEQIVRRELATAPGDIERALREALAVLEGDTVGVEVYLHPEDRAAVEDLLAEQASLVRVKLIDDPYLLRGGCRVKTATSLVDATTEQRLRSVVEGLRAATDLQLELRP
jgi:flagellar assembly protein FliH